MGLLCENLVSLSMNTDIEKGCYGYNAQNIFGYEIKFWFSEMRVGSVGCRSRKNFSSISFSMPLGEAPQDGAFAEAL